MDHSFNMDHSFDVEGFDESMCLEKDVKLYDCTRCGYRSRWSANVRRHTKLKHQTRNFVPDKELTPFICDYCGKQYKHRYSLSVHRKLKHTKTFRFVCSRCDKGFIQLWTYRGHLASHYPELMNKCEVCGKSFAYKSSLKTHEKRCKYSARKLVQIEFTCSECKDCFKTKKNLVDHQRGQHGNKRFPCDVCGKTFKWRSSLSYHKRHVNHH